MVYLDDDDYNYDKEHSFRINQNTFDNFHRMAMILHGISDPNTPVGKGPTVYITNNIITSCHNCGIELYNGMNLLAKNNGYANNAFDKNWDFTEYGAVYDDNPYSPDMGELCFQHAYLVQDCNFVNAGDKPVEFTQLIGLTTDVNSLPDTGMVDLGFHWMNGIYDRADTGEKDVQDLLALSTHWLCYDPYEPNSPGYIDPNLIDPNRVTFAGDLNGDYIVNIEDFAMLANTWQNKPHVTAVIEDTEEKGCLYITPKGCDETVRFVYVFLDGVNCGRCYSRGREMPLQLDITKAGNRTQELKLLTVTENSVFYSDSYPVCYDSPYHYCTMPLIYEPNEPLIFSAINTLANPFYVTAYDMTGDMLWQQEFAGESINGSIPAWVTVDPYFDFVRFGDPNDPNSLPRPPIRSVPDKNVDKTIQALIIEPDLTMLGKDPLRRFVIETFRNKNIKYQRLSLLHATWDYIAQYAQHCKIKYIYIASHGDFKIGSKYRTIYKLYREDIISCKKSEFVTPPAWCEELLYQDEQYLRTWASMGFNDLELFYAEPCYGGRLLINMLNQLKEGTPGQQWYMDGTCSDMTLSLNLDNSHKCRGYHGWHSISWFKYPIRPTTYQKWTEDVWTQLGQNKSLYEAIQHAIQETAHHRPGSAIDNYRLYGQGDMNTLYLSNN
jgi:hypothetical protein